MSARVGVVPEARGKSSARGGLHGGCGRGPLRRGRRHAQLLLLREIAFLRQLLALEEALLSLQRTLRLPALRFLRLQLLHVLLQAIDPGLALGTLARQRIALPLLRELLALLRDLLALRDPLFARLRLRHDPLLPRRTRAHGGRCGWAPRFGDARTRARGDGRRP